MCKMDSDKKNCRVRYSEPTFLAVDLAIDSFRFMLVETQEGAMSCFPGG